MKGLLPFITKFLFNKIFCKNSGFLDFKLVFVRSFKSVSLTNDTTDEVNTPPLDNSIGLLIKTFCDELIVSPVSLFTV